MKLYDILIKEKQHDSLKDVASKGYLKEEEKPFLMSDVISHKPRRKKILLFLIIITLLTVLYSVGLWVQYAKVTLYQRSISFTMPNVFFDLSHQDSIERTSPYTFQTITVTSTLEREVIGTEFKDIKEYAQGAVVFSNEWSKSTEVLKGGTIIESLTGKKYKTTTSASVGGYTTLGTQKKPGESKPVPIMALEPGSSSNNPGTTFTIPSFSSKKRQLFFAKSVGPLLGGDSGVRHALSKDEEETIVELLKNQLTERLRRETRVQVPEDFVISPDMQYTYINTNDFQLEGESIKFVAQAEGKIVSYLIKRDVLYRLIAEEVLQKEISEGQFYIPNFSDITFQVVSPIPTDATVIPDNIRIQISGTGTLTSVIDPDILRKTISGMSVKEFKSYVSQNNIIEKAEISLFPFWSPSLPKTKRLLHIIVR